MKKSDVDFGEFLSDEPDIMAAYTHLCRSISAICRSDRNVIAYYIGKASGVEPIAAIKGRYDKTKEKHKFAEDWALYESKCCFTVGLLEDLLNDYYMRKDPQHCTNKGKGSAGRPSGQPNHYLYLALRRK